MVASSSHIGVTFLLAAVMSSLKEIDIILASNCDITFASKCASLLGVTGVIGLCAVFLFVFCITKKCDYVIQVIFLFPINIFC